jgi:DEAD/DEAH box helicase domain-containing protein
VFLHAHKVAVWFCLQWWDIPADVMQKLNNLAYDALVVLRRVVLSLLPSMTMSDPTDTAGLEVLIHEQTQLPQIFIFDAYPGGIGISEQAFKDIAEAWKRALCVLHSCNCSFGCPSCTQVLPPQTHQGKASHFLLTRSHV